MISPHDKDNLKPLRSQSPKRLMMAMSFNSLVPIVGISPLAMIERDKRKPVCRMAHQLVTGKPKLHHTTLATRLGHRNHSRLGLKMAKRFPSALGISEFSPKRCHNRPALGSRQRLNKFSRRHRGEKTFDFLVVALHRFNQTFQLNQQHFEQLRLGSDHMFRHRQLRLMKLLPELFTARLAEVMPALGKAVPMLAPKLRESLRGGILLEKIQRYLGFQIRKNLQGSRIVLFECADQLIEDSRFLAPQPVLIPTEHLKLLGRIRVRLKRSQVSVIGPNKLCQDVSVKGIALGLAHAKPVPGPIQGLGIDRIDHCAMVQQKIHYPAMGLLNGRPKLDLLSSVLIEPAAELAPPLYSLGDLHLDNFLALWITHPHLIELIRPIHAQIISLHALLLLGCVLPIPTALNGKFALYRSSPKGQLSIKLLLRSLAGRDSLSLILKAGNRARVVLMPASS